MSFSQLELEQDCIRSIESQNVERVKELLTNVFGINSFLTSQQKIWDTNSFSILSIACFYGSVGIVKFMLDRRVNVNEVDNLKNRTALHWSVASGNYEISKLLIEAGAFVNAIDRDSITPIILASNLGDLATVRLLIENGAKLAHRDRVNTTALHQACMRSHLLVARELIVHGGNINTNRPFSFSSPLKYLISNGHYAMAKFLIHSGCDLSAEASWIKNQQYLAKKNVDPEFIDWLNKYTRQPRSLLAQCRQSIRSSLGSQYLSVKVDSLSIPRHLKLYLLMQY